jgi:type II restriction enzyme
VGETINLSLEPRLADKYSSPSQKIRVLSEHWVDNKIYCPNCGNLKIEKYGNNRPVADFFCSNCKEDYELKSKKERIGSKIVDGAYRTMMERLQDSHNPNLFLLNYDLKNLEVLNFLVIPKQFFIPGIIEKRKPLSSMAIYAGWVGCNILFRDIPETGKIFLIKNKVVYPKEKVLAQWQKTLFLRGERELCARGWLIDVMLCVEKFKDREFSLEEVYSFENILSEKHPDNHNIKAKIRQQLQLLRDKGYLNFIGRGKYMIK